MNLTERQFDIILEALSEYSAILDNKKEKIWATMDGMTDRLYFRSFLDGIQDEYDEVLALMSFIHRNKQYLLGIGEKPHE